MVSRGRSSRVRITQAARAGRRLALLERGESRGRLVIELRLTPRSVSSPAQCHRSARDALPANHSATTARAVARSVKVLSIDRGEQDVHRALRRNAAQHARNLAANGDRRRQVSDEVCQRAGDLITELRQRPHGIAPELRLSQTLDQWFRDNCGSADTRLNPGPRARRRGETVVQQLMQGIPVPASPRIRGAVAASARRSG